MPIRTVLQIGEPALRAVNKVVENIQDDAVKEVAQDLIDSMRDARLVGMAAPQLGTNLQIFVTEVPHRDNTPEDQYDDLRVYVNPKIIEASDENVILYEGCGSIIPMFGPVSRSKIVTVEAFDLNGKKFRVKADGIIARVILHEYDHLEGILFTDKLSDPTKLINKDVYRKFIRGNPDQAKNSTITIKEFAYI